MARPGTLGVRDALTDQEPRSHWALSLHLDRPAWLALELVVDELVGRVAEVDAPRRAVRLHPARRVHRVAPDVEHELAQADDPTNAGPAVHAKPEIDPVLTRRAELIEVRTHVERQARHRLRVVSPAARDARDAHEVVADGADLLRVVALREQDEDERAPNGNVEAKHCAREPLRYR